MTGISTTGKADTRNYNLPRGCVLLSPLDDNDCAYAWREVGNSCTFELEISTSTESHYSCKEEVRIKDLEYITELDGSFTIELDEWMYENLAAFFVGDTSQYASGGFTPDSKGELFFPNPYDPANTLADARIDGRYYEIFEQVNIDVGGTPQSWIRVGRGACDHSNRVYNIDATNVQITLPPAAPAFAAIATYEGIPIGTIPGAGEFEVDEAHGLIFVRAGSQFANHLDAIAQATASPFMAIPGAPGSVLATDTGILYGPDASTPALVPASSIDQMQGVTSSERVFALKYLSVNAVVAGEKAEIHLHKVRVRPNGSLGLISETDLATFELAGSMEKNTNTDIEGGGFISVRKVV